MDVRLPNGTVIQNVPDGTTKAALLTKLQSNGMSVPQEWFPAGSTPQLGSQVPTGGDYHPQAAPPPTQSTADQASDALGRIYRHGAAGPAELLAHVASGAVAAPAAGLAGLGTLATNALAGTNYDPAKTVADTQDALTYQPRTGEAQAVVKGLSEPGQVVGSAINSVGQSAADATGSPLYGALTAGALGAAPQALTPELPRLGASRVAAAAQKAVQTGPKQAALQAALDAGYHAEPSDMVSAPAGKLAAGLGGKNDLNSATTIINQHKTNSIAKADIGIPADKPLNADTIAARDAVADAGYAAIKDADKNVVIRRDAQGNPIKNANGKMQAGPAGPMQPDPVYTADVAKLGADRAGSQLGENPGVVKLRDQLTGAQGALRPEDAINDLKTLRNNANSNLLARDNPAQLELGKAQRQAADAMEERLERYLQQTGQTDLYNRFTAARTLKAKIRTVKDNINTSTFDVDASGVAGEDTENPGKLTGGLKTIANAAKALPNTVKTLGKTQAPAPFSALGLSLAASAAGTGEALGHAGPGFLTTAAILGARPALRAALNSKLYQGTLGAQTPAASALSRFAAQPASPLAGLLAAPTPNPLDQPQQ